MTGTPTLRRATSLSAAAAVAWYNENRERSARLFSLVDPQAFTERPIALRHPFIFYEGHFPAFSYLVVNRRALGESPIDARLERLFERGIDPGSLDEAQMHSRADWPQRAQMDAFIRTVDERVRCAIEQKTSAIDQAVYTALEHEQMHHETLTYIIHQLDPDRKGRVAQIHHDNGTVRNEFVEVPAGVARLGASRDRLAFGWDNEFEGHEVAVDAFAVQRYPVTNGEYLEFVRSGGPIPHFWHEIDGEWQLRAVFEELPLPLSWPAYVTKGQAEAYARWRGWHLMSEAQYDRAAYGNPDNEDRRYPWGDDAPSSRYANVDFDRFDPQPVDACPAGASAWEIHDLVGNGWEWTATPFAPFPGFAPMPTYPQYSADFFDGQHYVLKGASPVTARELIRRSFRNWFYADYPYMYAKFRCVA